MLGILRNLFDLFDKKKNFLTSDLCLLSLKLTYGEKGRELGVRGFGVLVFV